MGKRNIKILQILCSKPGSECVQGRGVPENMI